MYSALRTLLHMHHFSERFDEVACAVEVVKYCHSVQLLGNHPNVLLSLNKKLNFFGLYSSP